MRSSLLFLFTAYLACSAIVSNLSPNKYTFLSSTSTGYYFIFLEFMLEKQNSRKSPLPTRIKFVFKKFFNFIKKLSYHSFLERINFLSSAGICSSVNFSLNFYSNFKFFFYFTHLGIFNLIFL
jgi:hypothetical protein